MIETLVIAALGVAALAWTISPLRSGPRSDAARTSVLVEEADERKRSALIAIIEIEEEHGVGKLSDDDHDELRVQYENQLLAALRELDELGAERQSEDLKLEAEIARIRAEMVCPACGAIRPAGGSCPRCGTA